MIAAVAAVLAPACAALAINAPPGSFAAEWAAAEGRTCLSDDPNDPEGPLAGVKAGLQWARSRGADWLVTAPCDTPWLPHDLVARLGLGGGPAVAETDEGGQWLCALWPVSGLEPLSAALAGGRHGKVETLLSVLGAKRVRFADASAFANVNRPEDLTG